VCGIVVALPVYSGEQAAPLITKDLRAVLPVWRGPGPGQLGAQQVLDLLTPLAAQLHKAVTAFSTPGAALAVATDFGLCAEVTQASERLTLELETLDATVDALAQSWGAERTEQVQALLRQAADQVWTLRHDRIGTATRARALSGDQPLTATSSVSWNAIETTLSALDRLEVRGRDSAGLTVWVCLDKKDREGLVLPAERADPLLRSGSAVATRTGPCFVYKKAAIIGALGDNVRALRASLQRDRLLQHVLGLPSARVTVVAHTRWASVGRISEANAHPVDSVDSSAPTPRSGGWYAVAALNGDIDNHLDVADRLGSILDETGISTDAKVIPLHLVSRLGLALEPAQAMCESLASFAGSMAIAAVTDAEEDAALLAVKGSGQSLYVGLSPHGFLVASEAYGLVGQTSTFFRVTGGARSEGLPAGTVLALHREGAGTLGAVQRRDGSGATWPLHVELLRSDLTTRDLARGSAEHYLQKEILEAPASVRKTLRGRYTGSSPELQVLLPESSLPARLRQRLSVGQVHEVAVIGQGTAAVACQGIARFLQVLVGDRLRVSAAPASEFSAWQLRRDMSGVCVVAVSQSGSTADTNRSVDLARQRGATVVSVINRRDSDLAAKSEGVLYTSDGRDVEMSVASTKAFYAQAAAGNLLALQIAKELGVLPAEREASLLRALLRLPEQLSALHGRQEEFAAAAAGTATRHPYWSVVGSGPNRVAAEEIRIKLSELCYKTLSADAVEDKKHIDLSAEALVLVCAAGCPPGQLSDLIKEVDILKAHGNQPVVFCDAGTEPLWHADIVIGLPPAHPEFAWILSTAAGHLFAYYAARAIDASADGLRLALDALERVVDAELAPVVPRDALVHVGAVLGKASRGELQGVLTNRTAMLLAMMVTTPRVGLVPDGWEQAGRDPITVSRVVLTAAIEELGRSIDTVKHQAKTVTVGTSRDDADLYENVVVQVLVEAGADPAGLTLPVLRALRAFAGVIAEATGATRYAVIDAGDHRRLQVIRKTGAVAGLVSRADAGAPLTGSKRHVVQLRAPRLLRGRADGRTVLVVPEQEAGQVAFLDVVHVHLKEQVGIEQLLAALAMLGDRRAEIEAAVTETAPSFDLGLLQQQPVEQVLLAPIDELVERLAQAQVRAFAHVSNRGG